MDVTKALHWARVADEAGRTLPDRAAQNTAAGIVSFAANLRALGVEPVIGPDIAGSFACFFGATLLAAGLSLVHAPGITVNRSGPGFVRGDRRLGRVFVQPGFAALSPPEICAFHDCGRAAGIRRYPGVIALARRCVTTLRAILRSRQP